jgi:hypothetical protein
MPLNLCLLLIVPLQLTASEMQIRSYVFDVVRATVPSINLDDVFTVSGTGWRPAAAAELLWLLVASATI